MRWSVVREAGVGTWQVRQHPEGTWQVLTPGGTQACARTRAREAAVMIARLLAGDEGGGTVLAEDAAGDLERLAVPTSRLRK